MPDLNKIVAVNLWRDPISLQLVAEWALNPFGSSFLAVAHADFIVCTEGNFKERVADLAPFKGWETLIRQADLTRLLDVVRNVGDISRFKRDQRRWSRGQSKLFGPGNYSEDLIGVFSFCEDPDVFGMIFCQRKDLATLDVTLPPLGQAGGKWKWEAKYRLDHLFGNHDLYFQGQLPQYMKGAGLFPGEDYSAHGPFCIFNWQAQHFEFRRIWPLISNRHVTNDVRPARPGPSVKELLARCK